MNTPAKPSQEKKFLERRSTLQTIVTVNGHSFIALQNVYDTSTDTELMSDVVKITQNQTFLEIGCGIGAVSLLVGKRAKKGLGVDINSASVKNAELNRSNMKVGNVKFILSDVFESVDGVFDVIICNPPYNAYKPADEVEMMFWDEDNKMKIRFFKEVTSYLRPRGTVYFGWADFEDLDQNLPLQLAQDAGLTFVKKYERKRADEKRTFFVYEFKYIV